MRAVVLTVMPLPCASTATPVARRVASRKRAGVRSTNATIYRHAAISLRVDVCGGAGVDELTPEATTAVAIAFSEAFEMTFMTRRDISLLILSHFVLSSPTASFRRILAATSWGLVEAERRGQ